MKKIKLKYNEIKMRLKNMDEHRNIVAKFIKCPYCNESIVMNIKIYKINFYIFF